MQKQESPAVTALEEGGGGVFWYGAGGTEFHQMAIIALILHFVYTIPSF